MPLASPFGLEPFAYPSPFNNTPLADSHGYSSAGGANGADGTATLVTLTFAGPVHSPTILWAQRFALGGSPINCEQVALLRFSDFGQGGLTSVRFSSSQAAFEFALAPAPISLSASALLLLGEFGIILRQRKPATP